MHEWDHEDPVEIVINDLHREHQQLIRRPKFISSIPNAIRKVKRGPHLEDHQSEYHDHHYPYNERRERG